MASNTLYSRNPEKISQSEWLELVTNFVPMKTEMLKDGIVDVMSTTLYYIVARYTDKTAAMIALQEYKELW